MDTKNNKITITSSSSNMIIVMMFLLLLPFPILVLLFSQKTVSLNVPCFVIIMTLHVFVSRPELTFVVLSTPFQFLFLTSPFIFSDKYLKMR